MTDQPTHPTNFDDLLDKAFNHVQALQSAHSQSWGLGKSDRYDIDFEEAAITWTFENEKIVTAEAHLIGTWSGKDETFLWGWDHPMAPSTIVKSSQCVKDYADKHKIEFLQNRQLNCSLEDTWPLASLAVLLGEQQGLYRFSAGGGTYAFIGFGKITISPIQ